MSEVRFKRPDGKECSGFHVEPLAGGKAPGIVVIQEWWGVNDQIKGVASSLAEAGYRVLVPDLYRGKVTVEAAEAGHLMNGLDFLDAAKQDIRGAAQFLSHQGAAGDPGSAKVGVIGFCMGGALSILTAVFVPEIHVVVDWYGVPPSEAGDTRTIRVPVQGHFALRDGFFTIAMVDALEKRLNAAGVVHEFYRYDADHAFGNEHGAHYDAQAKKLAWQRTLDFFATHLWH